MQCEPGDAPEMFLLMQPLSSIIFFFLFVKK